MTRGTTKDDEQRRLLQALVKHRLEGSCSPGLKIAQRDVALELGYSDEFSLEFEDVVDSIKSRGWVELRSLDVSGEPARRIWPTAEGIKQAEYWSSSWPKKLLAKVRPGLVQIVLGIVIGVASTLLAQALLNRPRPSWVEDLSFFRVAPQAIRIDTHIVLRPVRLQVHYDKPVDPNSVRVEFWNDSQGKPLPAKVPPSTPSMIEITFESPAFTPSVPLVVNATSRDGGAIAATSIRRWVEK